LHRAASASSANKRRSCGSDSGGRSESRHFRRRDTAFQPFGSLAADAGLVGCRRFRLQVSLLLTGSSAPGLLEPPLLSSRADEALARAALSALGLSASTQSNRLCHSRHVRALHRRPSAWPSGRIVSADHPDPDMWDLRNSLGSCCTIRTQYPPSRVKGLVSRQVEPLATFRLPESGLRAPVAAARDNSLGSVPGRRARCQAQTSLRRVRREEAASVLDSFPWSSSFRSILQRQRLGSTMRGRFRHVPPRRGDDSTAPRSARKVPLCRSPRLEAGG